MSELEARQDDLVTAETGEDAPVHGCPVVGIGASAGDGVGVLLAMFAGQLPNGLAYVFVERGTSDYTAYLERLRRPLSLPVIVVDGPIPIRANHLYFPPGNAVLTFRSGLLCPHSPPPDNRDAPISGFLTSLAKDRGARAAGVLLSGSGPDGITGLRAIKEAGGITIAQSEDGAAHDPMLRSAIDTGLVDLELPAGQIVERLGTHFHHLRQRPLEVAWSETEARLDEICTLLRDQTGHDFHGYKTKTLVRRIQRRIQLSQDPDVAAYLARLRTESAEVVRLFKDLLIGVTHFFRDPEAFARLQEIAIAALITGRGAGDTLRVWVPGCSTGEEAYSIAILFHERLSRIQNGPKLQIFATDIDDSALQIARAAHYPNAAIAEISPERLEKYFVAEEFGYRVRGNIREMCLFSLHNLLRDPPFSRIHLISCRNLLIYLNPDLQQRLIPALHYALQPGGFLFLGPAENVSRHERLFSTSDKKSRIFQRREGDRQSGPRFPVMDLAEGRPALVRRQRSTPDQTLSALVERTVLDQYAPAYVVINQDLEIVHATRGTGPYLELASGAPNLNILAMVRQEIRLELRAAIHKALQTRRKAMQADLSLMINGKLFPLILIVDVLVTNPDDPPLLFVLFQKIDSLVQEAGLIGERRLVLETEIVYQMEQELSSTKDKLLATTEELETSNEELKSSNEELLSMNEELHSTNEELATSKEELQSANEELLTLNIELKRRVEELSRANSDLKNLLENTQVPTLFLDRSLAINSFTPSARELFYLRDPDIGRPIGEITSKFVNDGVEADMHRVMATQTGMQREVTASHSKNVYIMRIHPYRTTDNEILGVVLTFSDITERIRWEEHQNLLLAELSHRVRNTLATVQAVAQKTLRTSTSLQEFQNSFEGRLGALATAHTLLTHAGWQYTALRDLVRETLEAYCDDATGNVQIDIVDILITPRQSLSLALALHEMATNAAKFGALSDAEGRVQVEGAVCPTDAGGRRLQLVWRETGGPPVSPPTTKGFGLFVIEQSIRYELKGEVRCEFPPTGFHCTILLPIDDTAPGVRAHP